MDWNWMRYVRDTAVDTATGYGLDDRGSDFESQKDQEFSFFHVVHTGFGAHPAPYTMGTGGKATGA
jgi:hypothetical protein